MLEAIFEFLGLVLDVCHFMWELRHWRMTLCFWVGVALATISAAATPNSIFRWIVFGTVWVAALVWGWIWDSRNN